MLRKIADITLVPMNVIDQIRTLSPTEAMKVMEALWDQLRSIEEEPASPDWHREELERRDEMVRKGEAQFIPWSEAKERIRKRLQ